MITPLFIGGLGMQEMLLIALVVKLFIGGKKITELEGLGFKEKLALREVLKKIEGTDIEKLLKEYKVI